MNVSSPSAEPIIAPDQKLCAMGKLSFSDGAAHLVHDDEPSTTLTYADDIDGVWDAVRRGEHGMIPIENSSQGRAIWKHIDVLAQANAHACGEVLLHVQMYLGGIKGAKITQATHVHSHPVGLDQCGMRLDELGIQEDDEHRIVTKITSDAPRDIAALGDPSHVCLASPMAIEANGLDILERDMANHTGANNITQFLVVRGNGDTDLPDATQQRHAVIVQPSVDRVGVLNDILGIIRAARVNLVSLHSQKVEGNGYRFFMEMEMGDSPSLFPIMRRKLEDCSAIQEVQWLGSWGTQLYSNSIDLHEPMKRDPNALPEITGEELDPSRNFHGVIIQPDDYPGALFDITHAIRTSDVDLKYLHSQAVAHKQYRFLLGMDSLQAGKDRLGILLDHLCNDTHLQAIEWLRSTDSEDGLRELEPAA